MWVPYPDFSSYGNPDLVRLVLIAVSFKRAKAASTSIITIAMPSIFFGYPAKKAGPTKLAVDTPVGQLEPAEPSVFKIYAVPDYTHPTFSMISSHLGHLVNVLASPQYTQLPLSAEGDFVTPPNNPLPFRLQNLAFVVHSDIGLSDVQIQILSENQFTSMRFGAKIVWLRENVTKGDFLLLQSSEIPWNATGAVPSRYLNPSAFVAYLSTLSLTTRICETLHRLSEGASEGSDEFSGDKDKLEGYKVSTDYEEDPDIPEGPKEKDSPVKFTNSENGKLDSLTKFYYKLLAHAATTFHNPRMSVTYYNCFETPAESFIHSGDIAPLQTAGKILKFEPKLAIPDVSIISDTIARHFRTSLGTSHEEQFDSLDKLRGGLSALRLTEVGDELAHLYKCIEVAIQGRCGLVPFFSGSFYEGCVLSGGYGTSFSVNGHLSGFEGKTDLRAEFLVASSHSQALSSISNKVPFAIRADVLKCISMVQLRRLCLNLSMTPDDRDDIIQKAASLRFSQSHWVISPIMLKRCFTLISNLSELKDDYPISRLCLFSKDPVLIALSCFGEKSAPSLNTPQGTLCSTKSPNPPSPPQMSTGAPKSKGSVSDAAWVMTIRKTDIMSAIDDFKVLADLQAYRSISTVMAKKQGFHAYSRDRMAEYWKELREAYRVVNPSGILDDLEKSLKRKGADADPKESSGASSKKPRTMKF
jgi:hypothetical protein